MAVKVVHDLSEAIFTAGAPDEAETMLKHNNIVRVHKSLLAKMASGEQRLWLILDYCDMGSLTVSLAHQQDESLLIQNNFEE